MGDLDAIMICEDPEGYTAEEVQAAWQHIYDSGLWRSLQGFYGRTVMEMLQAGFIEERE